MKVMLPAALDALDPALNVIFCEAPGVTLTELGDAVTPAGSPDTETEIDPLNELIAEAETAMSDPEPPA